MKKTRRKFTAAFKAKVAIEAIKERQSLAELSKHFELHPNIITKWKKEFLENSSHVFDQQSKEEGKDIDIEKLYAKIGQLEIENDFLKKNLKKIGL
ncbi:MAG TPA: transposase [Methanosarcina sp.]|nr:transposase [Methanosarcina sp.]